MLTRSAQLQLIEQEISRVESLRLEFGIRDKLFNCALGEAKCQEEEGVTIPLLRSKTEVTTTTVSVSV